MSILIYLLKVNLALMLSWALYRVAFKNLTFFQWNRFYILGSVVLSLILPLLRLQWNSTMVAAVDLGGIDWTHVDHLVSTPVAFTEQAGSWSPGSVLLILYMIVALTLLFRSTHRLLQVFKSTGRATKVRSGRINVYVQDQQRGSFTLFRRIYLDRFAYENSLRPVLRHEMVHAAQLHSLDLLFMEFVVAMLWFNPFVYVLFGYVRDNHEYLADRHAHGERGSLTEYLECLKAETIRYFSAVPASCFKSSTIKKRIIMLTIHKTNSRKKWRYLGIIPVLALALILFHSPQSESSAIAATESFLHLDGIPDHFPLPEAYKGKVSWGFDQKAIHPISKKALVHKGIDIPAPTGTPVYAAGGGIVLKAAYQEGWGKLIVLEHAEGYATFYAHLDEISVESGAKIAVGQVIGKVGSTGQSTGPHLHYEVRLNDEQVDPSDFY